VEVEAGSGSSGSGKIILEAEALRKKKLEAEANSEVTDSFIRSWKRKQKIFYCFYIPVTNKAYINGY